MEQALLIEANAILATAIWRAIIARAADLIKLLANDMNHEVQ